MICKTVEECCENHQKLEHTFSDRKGGNSRLLIENKNRKKFRIIDFEHCVYKNRQNDSKCDFEFVTEDSIFYIELKGSEVAKGIKQILSTYNETNKCFKKLDSKARLVVSKFPKPDLVKRSKEYRDLAKALNNDIVIKQKVHKEKI